MRRSVGLLACAALLSACGGGDEPRRFTLTRVDVPGGCEPPADAQQVEVFALGDFVPVAFSGPGDTALEVDVFPRDTRAFEVKVYGAGGALRAVGRTATLDLTRADSGPELPVFVALPRSFCPVSPLAAPRVRPLVVAAPGGALVAGGRDAAGPVRAAEWYEHATGRFVPISDPPFDDLRGARAATLPDGRVFLVWRGGYQIFDPARREFSPPQIPQGDAGLAVLPDAQVVALPDGRVLVAGGCSQPEPAMSPCPAAGVAQIYDPQADTFRAAPPLAAFRAGGEAIVDGDGRVWLVGGFGEDAEPLATVERWPDGELVAVGATGPAAPLPAGGFVVATAARDAAPASAAAVVPPFGGAPRVALAAAARAAPTVTALDDGAVLVVGGAAPGAAEAELYLPATGRFEALAAAPGAPRHEHGAALLEDGTVLVVGGRDASGEARADAWIYRHDLTGPWSSVGIQLFLSGGAPLVVPADPGRARVEPASAEHPDRLVLSAGPGGAGDPPLAAWAVLAGPRYRDVTVTAAIGASEGAGVVVLLDVRGPGDYVAVRLAPARPVELVEVVAGVARAPACRGAAPIPADALVVDATRPAARSLRVERRGADLRVELGETFASRATVLTCGDAPGARGMVGVGLVAGAPSDELVLDALEATR